MTLKGGYDKAKAIEPEYKKRCSSCGLEKDKREFEINQIQADNRLVRRGECKSCRSWKKPISQKKKRNLLKTIHVPPLVKIFIVLFAIR